MTVKAKPLVVPSLSKPPVASSNKVNKTVPPKHSSSSDAKWPKVDHKDVNKRVKSDGLKKKQSQYNWLQASSTNECLLTMSDNSDWYSHSSFDDDLLSDGEIQLHGINDNEIMKLRSELKVHFDREVKLFHQSKAATRLSGDDKWINDVIRSGTLSDKVAGLALKVQSSPCHELQTLDTLVDLCNKTEQRHASLALEATKDLLVHNLLPDRRLVPFKNRPFGHPKMTLKIALFYYFEDQLIDRIISVLNALDKGLKSNLEHFKKQCMGITADLLMCKPEQESRLLTMLVNKIGDPTSKIVSKAHELLKKLLSHHPAMRLVVVRELRQQIYKADVHPRVVYNGVVFLVQISLTNQDHELASHLVDTYLSLFEKAISHEELKSKLLAALLTGVNRAFPFLKQKSVLVKHVDSLFRIVHNSSFSTSTQALVLISHIVITNTAKDKQRQLSKQRQLEKEQASAGSTTTEADVSSSAATSGSVEVDLTNRFYRALYSQLMVDQVYTKTKNAMFLNLLYRSLKGDASDQRTMAFLKRLSICATQAPPPVAAAFLFLMAEVIKSKPQLAAVFVSLDSSNSQGDELLEENVHILGNFDADKREPLFALRPQQQQQQQQQGTPIEASSSACLWEMSLMRIHYHPSVAAFARSLCDPPDHAIAYSGDPTTDFTLTAFLNRFAYKNPKKKLQQQQSLQQDDQRRSRAPGEAPLNLSASFLRMGAEAVDPEKKFFHKFFGEREALVRAGRIKKSRRQRSGDDDDDDDGSGSDLDDRGATAQDDEDVDYGAGSDEEGFDGSSRRQRRNNASAVDSDEEREIDKFADELAEELMRQAEGSSGGGGPDLDDDSESELEDFSGDDDVEEGLEEDDEYASDGSSLGGGDLDAFGSDDDDDDNDVIGSDMDGDESDDALDLTDFKKAKTVAKKTASPAKTSSKAKRGSGSVGRNDSDSSDGEGYKLMAYGDGSSGDDSFDDIDDGEDDDDDSVMAFDSEGEEDRRGKPSRKAPKGKSLPPVATAAASAKKGGTKRKAAQSSSDFADADDYEAEMERIVAMVQAQAAKDAGHSAGKKSKSNPATKPTPAAATKTTAAAAVVPRSNDRKERQQKIKGSAKGNDTTKAEFGIGKASPGHAVKPKKQKWKGK